ncbi:stage V sporulation protein AC [Fusicatenibacter sp.]
MQSLKSERAKKEYEQFVKEVTPQQKLFPNMGKAFVVGGLICVLGQILLRIGKTQFSLNQDDAGAWCSLILILCSVILTGLNIYQKIVTFAGCGALVPITGFANSVAAPAIEYQKEGQVFGIGAKIFTIAGPVLLYGIFSSWLLGLIYWLWSIAGHWI